MSVPDESVEILRQLAQSLERIRRLCDAWVKRRAGRTIARELKDDDRSAARQADEKVKGLLADVVDVRERLVRIEDALFPAKTPGG